MTAAARLQPISEIVGSLADDIEGLCHKLLPGGRRERDEWVVPGAASPYGCSIGVHLRGAKAGRWKAWAADDGGDALDLVAKIACHGDKREALRWAREWLGGAVLPDPAAAKARREKRQAQAEAETKAKRSAAFRIWLSASPTLAGTPAEMYLRRRGIDLAQLGRQPRALRFHPALWNERTGRKWPALVAAITREGREVGVHRTWLTEDGAKAPIFDGDGRSEAKLSLGAYTGGLIPLWRGAGGKPLKDAPAGEAIMLSEGIEDGLSAVIARPELRCAAAVSLSNLGSLVLPPAIATVIILGQNDGWWREEVQKEHPARRGLDRAIRHFQAEGRTVRLARPPAGKDFNDTLRGDAA